MDLKQIKNMIDGAVVNLINRTLINLIDHALVDLVEKEKDIINQNDAYYYIKGYSDALKSIKDYAEK